MWLKRPYRFGGMVYLEVICLVMFSGEVRRNQDRPPSLVDEPDDKHPAPSPTRACSVSSHRALWTTKASETRAEEYFVDEGRVAEALHCWVYSCAPLCQSALYWEFIYASFRTLTLCGLQYKCRLCCTGGGRCCGDVCTADPEL